ncbi:MAG: PAS domain-containing protein, partial [Rhodobacteraceae bacterium]|nr:PAS domain-containing protein [Paracoccaceae bacterium]
AVVAEVLDRAAIACLGLDTVDKMGNEARAEMIMLPHRSDFGDVNRVIGCVTGPVDGFTAPMRFHVRTVDMNTPDNTDHSTQSFGFAENGAGFIMDGTSSFRTISGGGTTRAKVPTQSASYLKLVD